MTRYIKTALMAALMTSPMVFEAEAGTGTAEAPAAEAAIKKSIVPSKYSGKYKGGGSDDLAKFINEQCSGKDGFEYTAFFQLCRQNGIAEEKVAHYEKQVADKLHGSQGRARMTLRNMLAPLVRKNGKLKGLDGTEVELSVAKPVLTGAAAKAAEDAAAKTEAETEDASAGAADSTDAPVENDAEV